MSPPQANLHHKLYNSLPLIPAAYDILRQELTDKGIHISNDNPMLSIQNDPAVCALLRNEENQGRFFGIWIIHRHFGLDPGERMVSVGNITKPAAEDPSHIAERWDQDGNEIEFMQPGADDASNMAPSPDLVKSFRDLMRDSFGVSILGLCRAPSRLEPGTVWVETTDEPSRAQIVKVGILDELLGKELIYPSIWVTRSPDSCDPQLVCNCTCNVCLLSKLK